LIPGRTIEMRPQRGVARLKHAYQIQAVSSSKIAGSESGSSSSGVGHDFVFDAAQTRSYQSVAFVHVEGASRDQRQFQGTVKR